MQFGLNIDFLGEILGLATSTAFLWTVTSRGASPLYKRAHWRGSVPDTRANERGPKISKVALENWFTKENYQKMDENVEQRSASYL